jgi:hypothetical protein
LIPGRSDLPSRDGVAERLGEGGHRRPAVFLAAFERLAQELGELRGSRRAATAGSKISWFRRWSIIPIAFSASYAICR